MQVGGDGLFQEILNGLLSVRGAGGAAGELAAHLRLGHIPSGSTDAVAYSINGTRSQATATLHIALGDRHAPVPIPAKHLVSLWTVDHVGLSIYMQFRDGWRFRKGCSKLNSTQAWTSSSCCACRTPLDVIRADMEGGGHRYAVCVASYGYMGDLNRLSERLRFLGPARYGVAGAIMLLRGRAYSAEVRL